MLSAAQHSQAFPVPGSNLAQVPSQVPPQPVTKLDCPFVAGSATASASCLEKGHERARQEAACQGLPTCDEGQAVRAPHMLPEKGSRRGTPA